MFCGRDTLAQARGYRCRWRVEHEVTNTDRIIRVYIKVNGSGPSGFWEDWSGDPALLTLLPQHRSTRGPLGRGLGEVVSADLTTFLDYLWRTPDD